MSFNGMFVKTPSDSLRQGDILDKVYFIPASFNQLKNGQLSLPKNYTLRYSHFVIISQCCELQWLEDEHGNIKPRRPYVLIAPLSLRLPFKRDTEEYRKLVENGENKPDNDPVQYFYFEDNPIIASESVVDLSTIVPIRSSVLKELGIMKLLELKVKYRHLFRIRLREYFSRIPDEEWEEVRKIFSEDFT